MAKVRLELGAELDLLNKGELDDGLHRAGSWEREAAFGLRHIGLPLMQGTITGAVIALGADQIDGQYCGPREGFYWRIDRVSADGLADGDQLKLWKGSQFVTYITFLPGSYHPGGAALILRPGDFLRLTGAGLHATGEITMTGEATSVPGPMMWKLL